MKHQLTAALAAFCTLIISSAAAGSNTEPVREAFSASPFMIEEAASSSVAELMIFDEDNNRIALGSAFCAFSERYLITASHVLAQMDHLTAASEAGEKYRVSADDILKEDEDADIAVLLLPEDSAFIPLPCAQEIPLRGEKLTAIGSARGIMNLVTFGNVCGHWSNGNVDWLVFSAPVSAGSSGGPLINDDGEVVGVIMGSYDGSQNLNFAVPIHEAELLIGEIPETESK